VIIGKRGFCLLGGKYCAEEKEDNTDKYKIVSPLPEDAESKKKH